MQFANRPCIILCKRISEGFANLRLRQKPMIDATRQNSKILAPHGDSFLQNFGSKMLPKP